MSNLVKAQDARGWTYFTYDEMDRLTSELAPDGAETAHAYNEVGLRTRVTSPGGSTYYDWDAPDRMEHAQAEAAPGRLPDRAAKL